MITENNETNNTEIKDGVNLYLLSCNEIFVPRPFISDNKSEVDKSYESVKVQQTQSKSFDYVSFLLLGIAKFK